MGTLLNDLYKPQVTVVEQKANLDPNHTPPLIHASVTFRNHLHLPVQGVRLGFLLAASDAALKRVNVDTVYDRAPPEDIPLRAIAYEAAVRLEGEALVTSAMSVPMPAMHFTPQVFLTHVLNYHLADVDVATLLQLITSTASADQMAACEAFALLGDAKDKQAARQRWASKPELVRDLVAVVRAPAPEKPEQADTFARVYATCALGVLGGEAAEAALDQLAADGNNVQFDAPLQVLARARDEASPHQVPLAFAIPANTEHFIAVVAAAQANLGTARPAHGPWALGLRAALVAAAMLAAAAALARIRRGRSAQ